MTGEPSDKEWDGELVTDEECAVLREELEEEEIEEEEEDASEDASLIRFLETPDNSSSSSVKRERVKEESEIAVETSE